ncbi:OLC1v1006601C1 [Oldenlandia corymbosa var. corymbosa]|uniref:FAD-dependent oxidoreductase domain-containing protein 1 n=1 Tax=Oldenlandia corymbosa var. corymbosa TaxID=529605 RepID=A0AAV1DKF4_OLDCO|nr:OLC1v1006601C1 [Oldenlandia corymbosa var. corymbosa]
MVRCARFLHFTISPSVDYASKTSKESPKMAMMDLKAISNPLSLCRNQLLHRKLASHKSSYCGRETRRHLAQPVHVANLQRDIKAQSHSYDVVIVGAGIIGLTIARQFLLGSDLSVAIIDADVPCAGATGAGQGYIWRINKEPGHEKWELASRSHELWVNLADSLQQQGMDPLQILGWKKTGSLLVGKTEEECAMLESRAKHLRDAGLGAQFLSNRELQMKEPALVLEEGGAAVFLPDDCQLDAHRAVASIEKGNRQFALNGRYAEFYHEPATGLLRSESSGEIDAVQTSKSTIYSKKAVILAAGSWSGSVMHGLFRNSNMDIDVPVKPRKGHLLLIENFDSFKLNHALMEAGYVNHQSAALQAAVSGAETPYDAETTSVSMTATMDSSGRLVLGSSRQLVGFNTDVDESIITRIWERAAEFFPALREKSLTELKKNRSVRVGLRPYMPDGKPVIGPVPGWSKFYVAAGHEGEGLTLALGTAEMIVDMVLGNPTKVDPEPYTVHRCSS